jgi:hypothetical protein
MRGSNGPPSAVRTLLAQQPTTRGRLNDNALAHWTAARSAFHSDTRLRTEKHHSRLRGPSGPYSRMALERPVSSNSGPSGKRRHRRCHSLRRWTPGSDRVTP